MYLVLPERHVADGKVIEIMAAGGFKARDFYVRLGVKPPGYLPGDAVQLNPVQPAFCHAFGQAPEKIACAHGGFQNPAAPKAHVFQGLVHSADNYGRGIMAVKGGSPGRFIFLRGQKPFKLFVFAGPGGLAFIKSVRQPAPAHIFRECVLFRRRGLPVFRL